MKNKRWIQETRNDIKPLIVDHILFGAKEYFPQRMGLRAFDYKKIRDRGYRGVASIRRIEREFKRRAAKDMGYARRVIAAVQKDYDELIETCRPLRDEDFSEYSLSQLKERFHEVMEAYKGAGPAAFVTVFLCPLFESIIVRQVRKRIFDDKKVGEYIDILVSPDKETENAKAHMELLRIACMRRYSKRHIEDFIQRYGYLNMHFGYGEPYAVKDVKDRIDAMRKNTPAEKIKKIKNDSRRNKKESDRLMDEFGFDEKLKEIVRLAKEGAYFRTSKVEKYALAGYYSKGLFYEVAARIGASYSDMFYLIIQEVEDALTLLSRLEARKECFGAKLEDGMITWYTKEDVAQIEEVEATDNEKTFFLGTGTSKGRAIGRVKVVKSKEDLKKVEKGDILVAEFISVDYVPGMSRAGAVAVDIGGLASHAAVVSRELGKPCVVGLKDISKVLKDGEKVLVDAENGFLKKHVGLEKLSTGDYKVVLYMMLFLQGFGRAQEKVIGYSHKNIIAVGNYLRTRFFMDSDELKEVGDLVIKRLEEDPDFGERLVKEHIKVGADLIKTCQRITSDMKRSSNEQLSRRVRDYFNSFIRFSGYHVLPVSLEKQVSKKILDFLEEKSEDAYGLLIELAASSEETNLVKERRELLKIAVRGRSEGGVDGLLQKHKKKWEWMGVSHKYTPFKIEYYKRRFDDMAQDNPNAKLRVMVENAKKSEKRRKMKMNKLEMPSDIRNLVDLLTKLTFLRDFKRDTGYKSHYYMEKMWSEIGKRAGLSALQIKNCTPTEILDFLEKGKPFDVRSIEQRMNYFVIGMFDMELDLYQGEIAHMLEEFEAKEKDIDDVTEFSGMVANRGYVNGKVRVVLDSGQISKVKRGDIMIAVNTEPAMVPAMERAGAIVTDEGGVTCHAAIVSRELGVPCVIGTKIATQVLKDGDVVEVDAQKGIIRKK